MNQWNSNENIIVLRGGSQTLLLFFFAPGKVIIIANLLRALFSPAEYWLVISGQFRSVFEEHDAISISKLTVLF